MTNPSRTATLAAWDDRVSYWESSWLSAACLHADAKPSQRSPTRARLDAVAAKLESVTARRDRARCEAAGVAWLRLIKGAP